MFARKNGSFFDSRRDPLDRRVPKTANATSQHFFTFLNKKDIIARCRATVLMDTANISLILMILPFLNPISRPTAKHNSSPDTSCTAMKRRDVPNRLAISDDEPPGMDCFGEDREALNDYAKYYNNAHLSDVNVIVGEETFVGHRLILAKSSDVFDRMLSQRWNGDKKDLEIVEEPACQKVFSSFLRFMYCNHVVLHIDNCLPILILADKYNVVSLKKVCIDYAEKEILPTLPLKEVFCVWFSYATKAFHQSLIRSCIQTIAKDFETVFTEDWEKNWMSLDRDQLIELLRCNQLVVANEYRLWEAVLKWLQAPNHPERRGTTATPLLSQLLPLVRFAFMTADELSLVERSSVTEQFPKLFHPLLLTAYKWQALPLSSRTSQKDFTTTQFLLRKYTDIRWDKTVVVPIEENTKGIDYCCSFTTRSCTYPEQPWQWNLKLSGNYYSANDECLHVYLLAENIDSPRSVEYMLSFVDEKKVIKSISGKKNFTKTRYVSELELDRRVELTELIPGDSPLLVGGELHLQLTLKPID